MFNPVFTTFAHAHLMSQESRILRPGKSPDNYGPTEWAIYGAVFVIQGQLACGLVG